MSALTSRMDELGGLASKLQQQAAAGKVPASDAVEQILSAFLGLLSTLRASLPATAGSSSSSSSLGTSKALAALDRCQEQAYAGARMIREAAARQDGLTPDATVQYLNSLLVQLAADLTAELAALGPAEAAAAFKTGLPTSSGGSGQGGSSWRATPSQTGVQLGGSNALQELQSALAGGVGQGLAAAGSAVQEVCVGSKPSGCQSLTLEGLSTSKAASCHWDEVNGTAYLFHALHAHFLSGKLHQFAHSNSSLTLASLASL